MNPADLIALLHDGVPAKGGRWADLGAGEGAFTIALADLLGPGAHITAVIVKEAPCGAWTMRWGGGTRQPAWRS